ncbi:MAG: flavodoxin family protein [Methanobrevibacter sp.]|jgi:multimeric flavodoxin WrbA|nr:flavodoxin family protein [Candidatus Methanovirga aequatorialis]
MILGICGSPRRQSTEYVLKYALGELEREGFKSESFFVSGKKIAPCLHCDYCLKNKECIQKDDMFEVYDSIKCSDGIIMASPIHNGGITAQLKAVMDRCRALYAIDMNILRGKIGMSITVGGDRIGGQELAIQEINTFYILNGIIPVGGGMFGANLGPCFWSQDSVEKIKKDEYGFEALNKTLKFFIQTYNQVNK